MSAGSGPPAQRTPEERARVLAAEIMELVLDVVVQPAPTNIRPTIEQLLMRALREAERAALWDVILHLSLELERKARPGGAAAALALPEVPD